MVPSPVLNTTCRSILVFTFLPVNRFLNKLVSKVPNNMLRSQPLCSITSFLIVSLTSFIKKPDS